MLIIGERRLIVTFDLQCYRDFYISYYRITIPIPLKQTCFATPETLRYAKVLCPSSAFEVL